jgi:adenylate cyclase
MMALVDRALALNPSSARSWYISGALRLWAGQPDVAIEHFDAALRLSPRVQISAGLAFVGIAHFVSRRFDQAAPKLLLTMQDDPSSPHPYRWLAACYAHMGRLNEAKDLVVQLRAITPVVIPDVRHFRNAPHRELFLSGLQLAAGLTA